MAQARSPVRVGVANGKETGHEHDKDREPDPKVASSRARVPEIRLGAEVEKCVEQLLDGHIVLLPKKVLPLT
jgi:hypothetical protein